MIQRIQTVYLLLSALVIASMAFLPFANFSVAEHSAVFDNFVFQNSNPDAFPATPHVAWGGIFFSVVNIGFALFVIFDYNNRRRQMRWCTYLLLFTALLWLTMATYAAVFAIKVGASVVPAVAVAMPIVAMIFVVLAKRAIHHDERLVRSSERLR